MDQAFELRNIMNNRQPQKAPKTVSRVITVTSGKGGVGKTNFTVNLAIWMAKNNKKVVIIDADFGLANIEVLFNIWPKHSFADVVKGTKSIPEVLTEGPLGIKFLSGGTGFRELSDVTDVQMGKVLNSFSYLDEISDMILIDTGAGISKTVTTFVKASNEAIVITTPEPTSISDSYTLIKTVLDSTEILPEIKIVLNRVDSEKEGAVVYERLKSVSERFLKITPAYLGSIANDRDLVKAVKNQKPVVINYPNASFSKSIALIGNKILNNKMPENPVERQGILSFIKRIRNAF